jgi:hypothetical protein
MAEQLMIDWAPAIPVPADLAQREAFYLTPVGIVLVQAVRNRANGKCECCGSDKQDLLLHHKLRFDIPELRTKPNNYVLLCKSCVAWVYSPANEDREHLIFLQDV